MLDTEEKQILDHTRDNRDLEELREQKQVDGYLGPMERKFIDDFYAVTSSMDKAMGQVPDLQFSHELDSPEYYAVKSLYMAKTGKDLETGDFISGLQRRELLNQSLIYLQPVLALALRSDFKEGRVIYDQLVIQLNQLNEEIKTAIKVQTVSPGGKARGKKSEQDEDDDDNDNDGDDNDNDNDNDDNDNDADGNGNGNNDKAQTEPSSAPRRSIWSRLTGRKPDPEPDPEPGTEPNTESDASPNTDPNTTD